MKGTLRPMRPSTIDERMEFYRDEFDTSGVDRWVGRRKGRLKFAMIPGRLSGIVDPRHQKDKDNVIIIDSWNNAKDVRRLALDYLPEGVYYDRNRYDDVRACEKCGDSKESCPDCYNYDGQQLAFDLDPENVDCPYHGHLGQKMDRGTVMSFCMYEFKSVRRQARELRRELLEEYDRVSIVFSGRGFHVVVDDEAGYALSTKERKSVATRIGRKYDIDEWVTGGASRLMRLPGTLNGLVSRKCVRIKDERVLMGFDPRSSGASLPRFMK